MSLQITDNTRTDAIKTINSQYYFSIHGTFNTNTFSLDWSEDGVTDWLPLKDTNNDDVTRTADSNGVVTVGRQGFLSGIVSAGAGHDLKFSLIPT